MYAFLLLLAFLWAAPAAAQTDPATLPLKTITDISYVGVFNVPSTDGTGVQPAEKGQLTYGGYALGVGPDGTSLYYGCHDWHDRLARISIPAMGGTASIIEPCKDVAPGIYTEAGSGNGMVLGGTLAINGRMSVGARSYYAVNAQAWSLWFGDTTSNIPTTMRGPVKMGTTAQNYNQRTIGGYMGVVPPEFRSAFGGDVVSGACCSSIISNSSYGPALYVWDSATAESTKTISWLLGYPDNHQTIGTYGDPGGLVGYGMGTSIGGVAMVAGTNTTLFFGQQGTRVCYGEGTSDPTLDGKPVGNGALYCYDPTSPYKGNHGYPYLRVAWAYRTSDLLAVKRGQKQPWDVKPYAIWQLPGTTPDTPSMVSATYNPTDGRVFFTLDHGGSPKVYVYKVNATTPPPVEVCGDGIDNDGDGQIDEGCAPPPPPDKDCVPGTPRLLSTRADACVGNVRTVYDLFTRDNDVPATGNGAACSATPYEVSRQEPCGPPPTPPSFTGRIRAQSTVTAGLRLTLEVDATTPVPTVGSKVWVEINAVPVEASVFDVDLGYYAGTPRGTRVILTVPGVSYLTVKTFIIKP
jgi:hypothetical protein